MSYQNQRGGTYGNDAALPPVNQKRFGDVIDYNQPRPQTGYISDEEQTGDDDRNQYVQRVSGPDRKQYDQRGGNGYDNYGNTGAKGYGSTGGADNATGFDAQDGLPVQLIMADPRTGKFSLNEEVAMDLITNYEGNISFVTVAGKYRTGKSFLLNRLLNLRGEGFTVDPTTDACTQGIWMWSKPIYSERDNLHIFFLDTEGSNSVEKSATHDAKIFALALLMSSYFIYNSVGSIDENSINDLSLTTQLSRNIAVSADESSENTLSYYTPKFLWALRDFTLELKDPQGRNISSNQYLENALTDQSTQSKASETNKKIRQALLNYFKDRECMTLVRPVNEESQLRKLNTLENNQIRPEFLRQVNTLREKILSKATAKQLKGVNLNMRMYVAMLQKYVEAINAGSVPNIATAWDHLVENECREAYEQSVDLFEIALKQFFFNEDRAKSIEELYNILKNIRDSALEKYNKITASIERNDIVQDLKNELKDYIDKKEQQVVAINEELNQTNNEELLRELSQLIRNNITSGVYNAQNIQTFHDDFNHLLTTYDAEGQGLAKTLSLIKFLKVFQPEAVSSLMLSLNKSLQSNQTGFEKEKARYLENEKNLKMNVDILKEKERNAAEELARIKNEKTELSTKAAKLGDQMDKLTVEQEAKLAEERKKAKAEADRLALRQKEIEELAQKNKELEDMINKKKKAACCNVF